MNKEIVILANGSYPTHDAPLSILKSGREIICCDGAAEKLIADGIDPNYIVGDLDSLTQATKADYTDRIIHITEQETNDLTKAFHFSLSLNPSKIIILGATGKREDHTIGNISLLPLFRSQTDIPIEIITNWGVFRAIFSTTTFNTGRGVNISIFSLDTDTSVISTGLKYPLEGVVFDSWWRATLNITSEERFTLKFAKGRLIVFISHK